MLSELIAPAGRNITMVGGVRGILKVELWNPPWFVHHGELIALIYSTWEQTVVVGTCLGVDR